MHVGSFSPINSKCTLSLCTSNSTRLLYYLSVIYCLGEVGLFMASLKSRALFIQDLGLGVKRHPGKPFLSHPHGKIHRQGLACTAITVYNGIYWSPSGIVGLEKVIIFLCTHFFRQHCRLSICENWLSWTNTVSEQKIPITILILKLGPCLHTRCGDP